MKSSTVCIIFLFSCVSLLAQQSNLELALKAGQEGQIEEARQAYLQLLNERNTDPNLLSNLALIEIKAERPLHAFALWQKALHFHPNFQPAHEGLAFLEQKLSISSPELSRLQEILSYIRALPLNLSLSIAVIFFLLMAKKWLFYLARKKEASDLEEEPLSTPPVAYAYSIFFVLFMGLFLYQKNYYTKDFAISLEASQLSLTPAEDGVQVHNLLAAEKIEILSENGENWVQIKRPNSQIGWVKKSKIFAF